MCSNYIKNWSVKFDDFLEYAHENWNFYDDPRSATFMKMADALISKVPREWSPDDVERIFEMIENFDGEGMMHTYALLSDGKHHSAEKAVEAAAMDISLLPNQTIVDSYRKCAA